MKKKMIAITAFMAVVLAGCGQIDEPLTTVDGNNQSAAQIEIQTEEPTNAVSSETITEVKTTSSVQHTTEDTTSKDMAFKIVDADYNQYDGTFGADEQQRIKSSVILSIDQLNSNTILPSIDYSPDFFNENSLIFISEVFSNTASEPPTINKVYYEDSEIQIDAERSSADAESIEWWCCFLEVSKSDIGDANQSTTVNVNIDGKLPIVEYETENPDTPQEMPTQETQNIEYEETPTYSNTQPTTSEITTEAPVQNNLEISEIFLKLNSLRYEPMTCDGIPDKTFIAEDGTAFSVNFSERWIWRNWNEEAKLTDELYDALIESEPICLQ